MLIMPAIDLRQGACVRLLNGRFDAVTRYGDPCARIRAFAAAGATWTHVVDLDGAENGAPAQYDLIGRLAAETELNIQCGGGVRKRRDVEDLLGRGVSRVVIGSAAIKRPNDVRRWLAGFGAERVCLALDVRSVGALWEVVVSGWTEGAGVSLEGALELYASEAIRHVLVTDVSRDGAMSGPNVALIRHLAALYPTIAFQASGGVGKIADLNAIRAAGASAAIVGRALYEERFSLEDALAL